jgi:hypothetical protein
MEYYSAIKSNEIMLFAGKWMELEDIMLSEVSHIQMDPKDKHTKRNMIIYTFIENMLVIVELFHGTREEGKEENDRQQYRNTLHLCRIICR